MQTERAPLCCGLPHTQAARPLPAGGGCCRPRRSRVPNSRLQAPCPRAPPPTTLAPRTAVLALAQLLVTVHRGCDDVNGLRHAAAVALRARGAWEQAHGGAWGQVAGGEAAGMSDGGRCTPRQSAGSARNQVSTRPPRSHPNEEDARGAAVLGAALVLGPALDVRAGAPHDLSHARARRAWGAREVWWEVAGGSGRIGAPRALVTRVRLAAQEPGRGASSILHAVARGRRRWRPSGLAAHR